MSAQVRVSVDTTGRSGPLVKHVVIHTNDPVSPIMTLTVTMQIVPKAPLPQRAVHQ